MNKLLGNRSPRRILNALFGRQHYIALYNMWKVYPAFMETSRKYLTDWGSYPSRVQVQTPMGLVQPMLYCRDDILTVNEIFCRLDYPCDLNARTIVDIGSNIGISALYFLTRNDFAKCYLFEPNPSNIDRIAFNLEDFSDRYQLSTSAVSDSKGIVSFGVESTGRYGGIGVQTGNMIEVECRHINEVLGEIVTKHDTIDILKMDIEGAEIPTSLAIDPDLRKRIRKIYIEAVPKQRLFPSEFHQRQYGSVVQLTNKNLL